MSSIGMGSSDVVQRLYPNRPDPPLPSTLPTAQLTGTYYHPGYKSFTLHEEPHPENPNDKILVAERPNMTWKYKLELHHVSGNFWIVYNKFLDVPIPYIINDFSGGEFKIGVDGKVASLDIHWKSHMGWEMDEGTASFKRMS